MEGRSWEQEALRIVSSELDGCRVLRLSGELDVATTPLLERAALAGASGEPSILVDLRELTFIDSSGLRALLGVQRHVTVRGGHLMLVPGPPAVQRVFELTGLAERFAWQADSDT